MNLSPAEKKVLEIVAERQLVKKSEIVKLLKENGFKDANESLKGIVDATTKNLVKKDYVTPVNPIGGTCFAITKDGSIMVKDLE